MRQSRTEPWIQRWAGLIILILALFGASLTSYLTVTHFFGAAPALCTANAGEGCDLVLNSEYAKIFGIPLTIFGALGYLTIAGLAAIPLVIKPENLKEKQKLKQQTSLLLFIVSTATVVFSGYLMYLLAFEIKTACIYCITSALTVTSIWLLNLFSREWEDSGQLIFTGLIVGAIVLVGTLGIYSSQNKQAFIPQTYAGRLAQHLTTAGSKMYGAFWCPHCREQKELFGEAVKAVPYVECATNQANPRVQSAECRSKQIESYPTWEIGGKLYPGVKQLDELAKLSNYQSAN
ncbi:putative membrane protein [Synechococcus sp. PCC 7502]|uniref:vitamin K epoxide reductase family protein n=1 Tax=Synechococcus sp. PCC 7502 TaxID=1173263 RepID=UPI00029FDD7C|nr:vitamin K epoxide reductase family protein [Synechococcus sp. PCC 7502]AFY74343.1 putative membrane protein [Synechococcus sp. PCC 7502]